jgi:hypothetical protein
MTGASTKRAQVRDGNSTLAGGGRRSRTRHSLVLDQRQSGRSLENSNAGAISLAVFAANFTVSLS